MADSRQTHNPEEVLRKLETDRSSGLTDAVVASRQQQFGANAISEEVEPAWKKLLSFLWGPIPWMIEIAAILSAVVRHWADFFIIAAMLVINAGVGFWQEHKADNAIAMLKRQLALKARVLRGGKWQDVAADQLVPGDIVRVKLGDILPADVVLIDGEYLSVDQSALTGESLPVDRAVGDEAYSGSIARQGEMTAVVTAIGMDTLFGKTAGLVEQAGVTSHFQRAVLRIGNFLILVTLALVSLILIIALFRHDPLIDTLLFALVLTVAAIPVALPAVLSVTMAVGAERLARMKAIVARLVSIEEMAGMDVLFSDKTGTLTQNRLTLGEPALFGDLDAAELTRIAALASDRESPDAIDQAILDGVADAGTLDGYEVRHFHPFDPVGKRTEASVAGPEGEFKVSKGAPQAIAKLCAVDTDLDQRLTRAVDEQAGHGFRTLGVARTDAAGHWHYLGLLALFDPPREDSAATIASARERGIDVKMVTGDHLAIAREIAAKLKLGERILKAEDVFKNDNREIDSSAIARADGFAQVFPEHKFRLVRAAQSEGHIAGMTGDGVNDAPALKQADVGIAVSGATEAARAAADLVLTAPGLSVITAAIEEARRIFERMNSYAIYRIAETIRVLLFMTLSIIIFNFYPVTAVMIVIIALLNDFPIMMIAYDRAPVAPRPVRWQMQRVLVVSAVLGILGVIASFGLFWYAEEKLRLPRETIQSLIFLKLLVAGHLTIFVTRNSGALWQRPWPDWKFFSVTFATKIIGTLAAVYGWFVEPIGWKFALAVWGYALVWLVINNRAKILTYRLLAHQSLSQRRHLARAEGGGRGHR